MEESEKSWRKVESTAIEIFQVWMGGGELEWAREAWDYLYKANLVGVDSPLGKTSSNLHILTLGLVYHEFCRITWDEDPDKSLEHMIEQLELDPLALGVFAGSQNDEIFEFVEDDDELFEATIENATLLLRKGIHQCLVSAYGDDVQLCSRMVSTCDDSNDDDEGGDSESDLTCSDSESLQFVQNGFHLD